MRGCRCVDAARQLHLEHQERTILRIQLEPFTLAALTCEEVSPDAGEPVQSAPPRAPLSVDAVAVIAAPPAPGATCCLAPLLLALSPVHDIYRMVHEQRFDVPNTTGGAAMAAALLQSGASLGVSYTALCRADSELADMTRWWLPRTVRELCRVMLLALTRAFPYTDADGVLQYARLPPDLALKTVGLALRCEAVTLVEIGKRGRYGQQDPTLHDASRRVPCRAVRQAGGDRLAACCCVPAGRAENVCARALVSAA
jgi:hypothetical protein